MMPFMMKTHTQFQHKYMW